MSHLKERVQKDCLNCGTIVEGRFCQTCGQENLEPKETVWHFITHFFNDITHFDGKFFSTGKLLLLKPGFLSKEYIAGRRATYLHPIRMYVFTSAIFFIIFFSFFKPDSMVAGLGDDQQRDVNALDSAVVSLRANSLKLTDSTMRLVFLSVASDFEHESAALKREIAADKLEKQKRKEKAQRRIDSLRPTGADSSRKMNGIVFKGVKDNHKLVEIRNEPDEFEPIQFDGSDANSIYTSTHAYLAVQAKLPPAMRDSWFKNLAKRKNIQIAQRYRQDRKETFSYIMEKFLHFLPQVLFISLPLFAFVMYLLYLRHKTYYYVDHAVFSIHLFCANFIMFLLFFALYKLMDSTSWWWVNIPIFVLELWMMIYAYKAMRNFYQQRRAKTIVKFFLTAIISFILVMTLSGLFFLLSILQFQ